VNKKGNFMLHWKETPASSESTCGGYQTGRSDVLSLPTGTSSKFTELCVWNIQVQEGERISIETRQLDLGSDCSKAYIIVRDGIGSKATAHPKICGSDLTRASKIISTLNSMSVEVYANCYCDRRLFRASWRLATEGDIRSYRPPKVRRELTTLLLPTSLTLPPVSPTTESQENGGALLMTGTRGEITSPSFPSTYPPNRKSIWLIRGPESGKIRVTFETMDMESDYACRYDYVEIFDGNDEKSQSLGRFCGSEIPSPLTSSANELYVIFVSDSSTHGSGFSFSWEWKREGDVEKLNTPILPTGMPNNNACGGVFTDTTGTILSPGYPSIYPINTECHYLIKPSNAGRIVLDFISFDLEADSKCSFDYLQIRAGGTQYGAEVARLCGDTLPKRMTLQYNAIWITFKSDDTTSRRGFSLSYKTL